MQVEKVCKFFGGVTATARACEVSRQAVHNWKYRNKIPEVQAYKIERLSGGRFLAHELNPQCVQEAA